MKKAQNKGKLVGKYDDIFRPGKDPTLRIKQYNDKGNNSPIAISPYRMSLPKKELFHLDINAFYPEQRDRNRVREPLDHVDTSLTKTRRNIEIGDLSLLILVRKSRMSYKNPSIDCIYIDQVR